MSTAKSQLFFAAFPDVSVRKQLSAVAQQLQQRMSVPHHPQDLHMTLAFVGVQDADNYSCLTRIGDQVMQNDITLVIDQVGYWLSPRIVIAEPAQVASGLEQLAEQIWSGVESCGQAREARRFRPHITLQRKALPIEQAPIEPIMWRLDNFSLAESIGTGAVPRYRRLKTWSLASHDN